MRDGSLSYERFCVEAELLQKRSHVVARRQGAEIDTEQGGDIDELLIEEDNVAIADETLSTQEALQTQHAKTALLEFHIVYHTIYQTPVLYFRVAAIDGTPLPANIVTRGIQFPGSSNHSTFVAMEEHPVLGKPFSFLHPCETAGAMQLLQAEVQCTPKAEAQLAVEVPHYLASWLSLVQPLTGISPVEYYAI
ncbi:hypothetical protein JM18_003847 [Phytophthora kernoviae]|uniref:Ubiquitin-like-conjugating enzyme ATG10 n=1 Tax=Phytophthora kernoviae TaxID=325452 RepID=A0A8T0LV22_9STRA|nr:hypothetical protein JM16_004293 [Phytophthora kernoviae]KAG2523289.1 hypothetical protein JM18_003847 [Phytophthora kernoviae]